MWPEGREKSENKFTNWKLKTTRDQIFSMGGNCIRSVEDLWHFSGLLQALTWVSHCWLKRALKYNSPGIWRTSENRASPRTEWCNWPHKLSWKWEERTCMFVLFKNSDSLSVWGQLPWQGQLRGRLEIWRHNRSLSKICSGERSIQFL